MANAAIIVITGAPGSGKTTVAQHLAQRFNLSLHIPTDELRSWVVSGRVEPIPVLTPPAIEQLRLAREVVSTMAGLYQKHGYSVIVDDVLVSADLQAMFTQADQSALHKILLCPTFERVIERNYERYRQFDRQKWQPVIASLYQDLCRQNTPDQGWIVLDTSNLNVTQTVDAILDTIRSDER
ncbi:AAA family ATPase [Herpetosiphon gulosus]|uniref:Phosphotransferase n=1 Tax=Herpetosiphon gulosus TaxID=1973496 RepID=A0ABP9X179_9CHLR